MPGTLTIFATQDTLSTSANLSDDWNTLRDGGNLQVNIPSAVSSPAAIAATKVISGRTIIFGINRSFFEFDTSSITHVPKEATIFIYGYSFGNADISCCRGFWADGGAPSWGGIYGYVQGGSDGSGGGDQNSNVTHYASETTSWTTSGYNQITFNQQAKVDMIANDRFKIALLEYDNDLRDREPSGPSAALNKSGLFYSEYAGTTSDPKIKVLTQDDSVFFAANF